MVLTPVTEPTYPKLLFICESGEAIIRRNTGRDRPSMGMQGPPIGDDMRPAMGEVPSTDPV